MQFLDRTVLRLLDHDERAAILTPDVGSHVLSAAFVFGNVEVGNVTGVTVRSMELLPSAAERQPVEMTFFDPASMARWEASGELRPAYPHAVADARVELLLTTETRLAQSSVVRVDTESLDDLANLDAVDAQIVALDGALPAAPADLANRRFTVLKELMTNRFTQPDDLDIDAFMQRNNIETIDDLLAFLSEPKHTERVEVEIVVDGTSPSRIVNHRVIAAVRIEENPIARLHAVVEEVQTNRTVMAAAMESASVPAGMQDRAGVPVIVVFDVAALDDDDLPVPQGQDPQTPDEKRAARLAELQTRLTPVGIALAPI